MKINLGFNQLRILTILMLLSIFSVGISVAETGEPVENITIESMVEEMVAYYNSNHETLKEDQLMSSLISQFKNENVLVIIKPTNEIFSVDFEDEIVTGYYIGEEIEGISVEVEVYENTINRVYNSADPATELVNAWENGELVINPISVKMKIVNFVMNILSGFL
ncbi:MAG: hypothetical protein JXA38_04570 [Methanosarcinaceae archaeon]|nr:hypothetical protein [Methanosarcinaceae archaeon]